jgi:integrase
LAVGYVKTTTPGIYVRHQNACPAIRGGRCRCKPSYRAQRRDQGWSPTFKAKEQAAEWKSSAAARAERSTSSITFGDLARQWWDGVQSGSIGKEKGRTSDRYSETTLAGYRRTIFNTLIPAFDLEDAAALTEERWQEWIAGLQDAGLSRSRIANHVAAASVIYQWASHPLRRVVPRNPLKGVRLGVNNERPRERVANVEEAAELLSVLPADVQVPYGLAFYAGLRRSEIDRLEWRDVDLNPVSPTITVRRSKSDAGTGRRLPIAAPLLPILEALEPRSGKVCQRSVMSGKHAARARKAWKFIDHDNDEPKEEREPPLEPIGLHECRHTYASLLMAAGYNLKELMEYLGHADLSTTSRYVKMLPAGPAGHNPAEKLNKLLAGDGSA